MNPRNRFTTLFPAAVVAIVLALSLSGCGLQLVNPDWENPGATSTPTVTNTPTEGASEFMTGDCEGRDITITEDNTTVLLTGTCASVTISADGTFATFEDVESITVTGLDNQVLVGHVTSNLTVEAASEGAFIEGKSAAEVIVAGNNTQVAISEVNSMTITGNDNFMTWTRGATSASDSGSGNTVLPASGN